MNPMYIAIPVVGGLALYLITKSQSNVSSIYQPPPGSTTTVSGGQRYQSYVDQLNAASLAYSAASLFDKSASSSAGQQFSGTLDVVGQMAQLDLANKAITQQDLTNIQAKIASFKKQIA